MGRTIDTGEREATGTWRDDVESRSVVAYDLRDTEDGPRLVGGRCSDCGTVAFPRPASCARCTGTAINEHLLASEGRLWTFTVQVFRPKAPYDGPEDFEPYGLGYVDLAGEVLVEARLTEADAQRLSIGDRLRLVRLTYAQDPDGRALHTFAFEPVGASA